MQRGLLLILARSAVELGDPRNSFQDPNTFPCKTSSLWEWPHDAAAGRVLRGSSCTQGFFPAQNMARGREAERVWVELWPLEIFPLSKTSALQAWRHPAASVSSSIPPSISATMVGKKCSLPASPDLNLTPHQFTLGPTTVSHRSQISRLDDSALEESHNTWPGSTVMPSKLISSVEQHQEKPWMAWCWLCETSPDVF